MESDKIQQMRDKLLVCSVCMEEFVDPRILQCHHTFCLKCLENMVKSLPVNAINLACPQCRQNTSIPRGGVNKLSVNFYLVSLKDELGAADQCGICQVCDIAHGQFRCVDCNLKICRFCIAPHRLEYHTAQSTIERLPSATSSPRCMASESCDVHSGEMLQLFCCTCQEAICISCSCSQDHWHHKLKPLSEQLQEIETSMQKELDEVINEHQNACKSMLAVGECKKSLISSSSQSISSLNHVATKSCEAIMQLTSRMEFEMKASRDAQISQMEDIENKLQTYIAMLQKGQDFLIDLQEHDICMEVVETYNKFSTCLKETRNRFTSSKVQLKPKSFNPSCGIIAKTANVGTFKTQLLYGNLGVLVEKSQYVSINKKNLDVTTKSSRIVRFLSSATGQKIGLFVLSFLFFNHMMSQFTRYGNVGSEFESEVANMGHEISRIGRKIADVGLNAFEDFFIPP